jgi:cell volume regulation protein A
VLLGDIEKAPVIFNIVFFVTLVSLLLQGTTIPIVARWLHLAGIPDEKPRLSEFEIELPDEIDSVMREIIVCPDDLEQGNLIKDLTILPPHTLVILVKRKNEYFVPTGSSRIEPDDILLLISDEKKIKQLS